MFLKDFYFFIYLQERGTGGEADSLQIPGPGDQDLNLRQMPNHLSHPGALENILT